MLKEGKELPGTYFPPIYEEGEEDPEDDEEGGLNTIVMTVPQASGKEAAIDQLQSTQATKNLGLYTAPEGSPDPQLEEWRRRVDEWTTNVKNSNLPPRSVWLSYKAQLWAGLKYGVGTTSATLEQLENKKVNGKEDGLGTRDHKILSRLGICRSCDVPWRYIPASHGGMELKNLTAEATAASLNLFLQHYGTNTSLGTYLTTTIENLQL